MMSGTNIVRRTGSRARVLMTGTLTTLHGSHKVLVRDISRNGAQIYADRNISAGSDACFERGPIFVAAQVAWCRKGETGLKFYRELSASEVELAFHTAVMQQTG
jgi:hypothetical protein